ncbi:hypothetical protein THAOC_18398, partial [Thalassiosira oceanica]
MAETAQAEQSSRSSDRARIKANSTLHERGQLCTTSADETQLTPAPHAPYSLVTSNDSEFTVRQMMSEDSAGKRKRRHDGHVQVGNVEISPILASQSNEHG